MLAAGTADAGAATEVVLEIGAAFAAGDIVATGVAAGVAAGIGAAARVDAAIEASGDTEGLPINPTPLLISFVQAAGT